LQSAVYYFFATNLTTEEERTKLTLNFILLDKDGDGLLGKNELKDAFKESGNPVSDSTITSIIKHADINSSNSINYSEFMVAAADRASLLTSRRIEACFRWFDIVG